MEYGQCFAPDLTPEFATPTEGLHIMDVPEKAHYNEIVTGLASSGVQVTRRVLRLPIKAGVPGDNI